MIFSKLFFVGFFLPLFTLIYFLMPDIRKKNIVLLIFSLAFYGYSGIRYLLLLILMVFISYLSAIKIERLKRKDSSAKVVLSISIAIMLLVLGVFKYTGFFMESFGSIFSKDIIIIRFALPLGISFYIFKLISYMVDVYRGDIKAESFFNVLLYAVIFHQSLQGPIVRMPEMIDDMKHRSVKKSDMVEGIYRFTIGLAKKTLLADHASAIANQLIPAGNNFGDLSFMAAHFSAFFYMLLIYLDFSAYSDMAIGLGRMIGFKYPENFNYPYIAVSVKDFWRRWHISLSKFFRDYIYFPLGGSRRTFLRTVLNLFVVWSLTGLWHGSSLNFVLWGIYYFVFIVIENIFKKIGFSGNRKSTVISSLFGHIYTLLVVYFGWVLFRFEDFSKLSSVLNVMLGRNNVAIMDTETLLIIKNNIFFIIISIFASTPIFKIIHEKALKEMIRKRESYIRVSNIKNRNISKEIDMDEKQRKAMKRIGRIAKKRAKRLIIGERLYYTRRSILMLILLSLSLIAMFANTYVPFLYNEF